MHPLEQLRKLAGIPLTESLEQHDYTFFIIDPHTGEFTKYYRGAVGSIIKQLEQDPENSDIAQVIKQQKMSGENGVISFVYDNHIYAFIPNNQ